MGVGRGGTAPLPCGVYLDGVGGDDLVVGSFDGQVTALDGTGTVLWARNYTYCITSIEPCQLYAPTPTDNLLVTERGYLHYLNASGEEYWNLFPEGVTGTATGDLDGDQQADLLVGLNNEQGTAHGLVYVYYGTNAALDPANATVDASIADARLIQLEAVGYFGEGLETGDFNGDGYDDIFISSVAPDPSLTVVFGAPR